MSNNMRKLMETMSNEDEFDTVTEDDVTGFNEDQVQASLEKLYDYITHSLQPVLDHKQHETIKSTLMDFQNDFSVPIETIFDDREFKKELDARINEFKRDLAQEILRITKNQVMKYYEERNRFW